MNSIKVCEYSWPRSFHDDLILQDQASGERSQDQWSSGLDIPQLIGKPRNVDTLLYREVSTFFRYTTIHGKAQKCGYFSI